MKKYFLLLFSLVCLVACAPDSKPTTSTAGVSASDQTSSTPIVPLQTGDPVTVEASVLAPHIGIWHYQSIAAVKDAKIRDLYDGRWIDLKGDQTFTSGVWQEQTNSGKWDFNAESQIINFFYEKNEGLYNQFKLNGPVNDVTIFMGNTPHNKSGIQIKMVRYPDRPQE